MWSFEGEHRKRPNVSLSGASRLMDKTAFLEKLRKERETRENNKRREVAAVRLQAFIRGSLCRIHTNQHLRSVYDELLQNAPTPLSETVAKTLCLKMLRLYRPILDSHRLVTLCSLLVRNNVALQQWMVFEPLLWRHILSEFIQLALKTIAAPTQDTVSATPQHAGPLRLLEVLTLPQRGKPSSLTPQQQADGVFGLLIPLIKKGYFKHLIALLVAKVPSVEERTTKSNSPFASSLLSQFLYPIYLVAACRRPSELWDASAQLDNTQLWDRVCGFSTCAPSSCTQPDANLCNTYPRESPVLKTDLTRKVTAATDREMVPKNVTSSVSLQSSETLDDPMESVLPKRDEANSNISSLGRSKVTREEDSDSTNKGKVLKMSGPENEVCNTSAVGVCSSSSSRGSTAPTSPTASSSKSSVGGGLTSGEGEGVIRLVVPAERSNKLLCYAFGGVPTDAPANYINLCLYNLVKEVFAASAASQVHHLLVPNIEESRLLLRHPAATHALLQAVHHVLAPTRGTTAAAAADGGGAAVDPHAPTKLATLLALVPVKTTLTTTSLQLYLQSVKQLVRHTALFLPQKLPHTPGIEGAHEEEELESEDDEDEEDDMEVDEQGGGPGDRTLKLMQKPPDHLVELGEWCLQHINSPSYVSWLLDEVETTGLDREVLVEFCGLTHTLLTAPCLSLFQCRLMYGVVGRQRMQRAMWGLLTSLYPSWASAPSVAHDRRERTGSSRLIDTVSRGTPIEPLDRDTLVPVLASFATALLAVLATLHDSELVTAPADSLASFLNSNDPLGLSSSATGGSDQDSSPVISFAFSVRDLVTISGTLRNVCIGLAELAHPDIRASTLTDVTYKPIWDHCFKCCVSVVRQLQLRDSRRPFCPPKHWLTSRISLPDLPHTASYRTLLARNTRRRTFMPTQWRTRAQLQSEEGQPSSGLLSMFEKVRATVLQELPFVFSFTDRAEVFLSLVREDRNIAQEHSAFNVGPSISVRVRRTHIYEDSFEKLSQHNEPNMRLSLRVYFHNAAGAVEAGVDGGGLFREFLSELLKSSFDPNRGFFLLTRDNTLYPNPTAHLLHPDFQDHYYFIGRMLGKALYEKLLVEIPLAGFFLSKLLSRKGFSIEFHHLDSLDPELCRNLLYLKTYRGDVQELGLDFTVLVSELGHNRVEELVPDGANIPVIADNKIEYIYRMADFKLNKQIAKQCYAFRKGLHDVVPAEWLQLFDWRELQTMISGSANPVNIADLRENTRYSGEYSAKHATVKLFWQVVQQFDEQQSRLLLKFVTSCSRPPLLGFKDLHPPFCIQPSGCDQRLPSASTCMNLLKLPEYSDPITLKEKLIYSITSNAGFELS